MKRPCYVVDAFSAQPLAGNAAGVLLDGTDLDDVTMQRIAAELKHSETAFPLPAQDPTAAVHLRWFTPTAEVAFCGHATLASFHVLVEEARRIRVPDAGVTKAAFTSSSGKLEAELSREKGALRVLVETPAARFEPVQVPGDVVSALGLVPEVLDPRLPPYRSAAPEGNLYLAVRDREALARVRPDASALEALEERLGVAGYVVYTQNPKPGVDAAMRCFFPGQGIPEDPATGSAAGQLGPLLVSVLQVAPQRRLVIAQGDELGRPGAIEVEVRPDGPGKVRGWIGGRAVTVLRGELSL